MLCRLPTFFSKLFFFQKILLSANIFFQNYFRNTLSVERSRSRSVLTFCPDQDPNLLDTLIVFLRDNLFYSPLVFLKEFFEKVNFEKSADDNKSMKNYPARKRVNH